MKKILIVEDDKTLSTALAVRLRKAGYEVMVSYYAAIAVPMAIEHRPELILMDISMPGYDGFAVAEQMQRIDAMAGVPIVFMTASKQPGLRDQAMAHGAAAFFEKPYDDKELVAVLKRILQHALVSDARALEA